MSHDKLAGLAERLIEDAQKMTTEETLNMALRHVVQVADAVDYRALSMAMCNGHTTENGHKIVHGDVYFRANTPRDCAEIVWMLVDTIAAVALVSPALNPIAASFYELRRHIEDTFGLTNMRTEATEIVNATGSHQAPDMRREGMN